MADWTRAVDALLPADPAPAGAAPAPQPRQAVQQPGLQLDLVEGDADRAPALRARPVVLGPSGAWRVAGTAWGMVGYTHQGDVPRTRRQRRLLTELLALSRTDRFSSPTSSWLDLTEIDSRRVWDLLCELRESGLPFVPRGRPAGAGVVHDPLTARLDVRSVADGLDVACHVLVEDGTAVPPDAVAVGDGAALVWWAAGVVRGRPTRDLHVAPVPVALVPHLAAVRRFPPVRVPAADVERFTAEYLPRVPDAVAVRRDGDVPAAVRRAELRVTVTPLDDFALEVRWAWHRRPGARRDAPAEHALVDAVRAALPDGVLPAGARPGDIPSFTGLPSPARLAALAAVRFATEALPALRAVEGLRVDVVGELPRYREARDAPVLTFDALRPADRDWYDLAVSVHVDGEGVPFGTLFTALVKGRSHLLLPSGLYFPLRGGRFADLVELIEESRALPERPEHTLRLSRHDTSAWDRIELLGAVEGRARAWRERARAVADAMGGAVTHPPPAGLTAAMRPYQRAGFSWLATLYENGLGGVLADDMGLGKTLQTLALVQHVRERGLSDRPFLVVAPTSVVSTWRTEAARFTPGLRVATVVGTARSRRGTTIADLARGADVVVTSYALFRLELRRYREVAWAGLVLDEAQNVKNHNAVAYRGARDLGVPWTLAVTGTPMENTLMELWALMSLVAPGLLPVSPQVFNDVYRLPIERARDGARLAALRRRVAPLILRRTKEQVARDLPAKTEQVLEVDLAPAHRRAYDAFLARERSKVLRLVDDLPANRFRIFTSLTLLRQAALDIALVDPDRGGVPVTKLDVLMELVADIVAEGHRVLVFSQFTRFLQAARSRMTDAGIEVCYLDGRTRRRDEVVARFREGAAPVFLVSLKAGGTGLTLTEADYCVILDPWWNPATESQAVDRTHRIGQTRPVMVYRLVARQTIEEKVMELKGAKARLFASTFDGEALASAALTADDVRQLVG